MSNPFVPHQGGRPPIPKERFCIKLHWAPHRWSGPATRTQLITIDVFGKIIGWKKDRFRVAVALLDFDWSFCTRRERSQLKHAISKELEAMLTEKYRRPIYVTEPGRWQFVVINDRPLQEIML